MSIINQINNTNTAPVTPETTSTRSAAGNGALATIDDLIAMLQKMNGDIRDMQREHYTAQQSAAHKKDLTAMASKEKAIELNYSAARGNATAKILSGGFSVAGAFLGGVASSGGSLISGGADGMGKISEGSAGMKGAGITREAQEMQLLGDYQSNAASEYWKGLAATADKAAEASRRMLEMTRELMSLQERIMGAVRL